MIHNQIQARGPESFEHTLREAVQLAATSGRETARAELHEALRDLSRKPDAEMTGAIQHSMAALECVARDVTGERNLTLGAWITKSRSHFPNPLDVVAEKLWGYTSGKGRHLKEGHRPTYEEAELVVGLAGALAVHLLRKAPPKSPWA